MDGMPSGLPGLPPPDSVMTDDQRQQHVAELLDRASQVFADTNGEVQAQASRIIDGAENDLIGLLEQSRDGASAALTLAEKKIAKPFREHNKAVGDHIQSAYDTIRYAGHTPITDITRIDALLRNGYDHDETMSLMLGRGGDSAGGGGGDVSVVRGDVAGIPQSQSGVSGQDAGGGTQASEGSRKEAYLERYARRFGQPGDVRYEIARHGLPSPRYPDDSYTPPAGTPVLFSQGLDTVPEGYAYLSSVGGYIPMTATPEGSIDVAPQLMSSVGAVKPIEGEPLPICPDGTVLTRLSDGSYQCTAPLTPPPPPGEPTGNCPAGWEFNPSTGFCEPINVVPPPPPPPPSPPTCPAGTIWNPRVGRCEIIVSPPPPPPPPPPPSPPSPPVPADCPGGLPRTYEVETIFSRVDQSGSPSDTNRGVASFPSLADALAHVGEAYRPSWLTLDALIVYDASHAPPADLASWEYDAALGLYHFTISSRCPPPPPSPPGGIDLAGCFRLVPCGSTVPPSPPSPPSPPTAPKPPATPPPPNIDSKPPAGANTPLCDFYESFTNVGSQDSDFGKWVGNAVTLLPALVYPLIKVFSGDAADELLEQINQIRDATAKIVPDDSPGIATVLETLAVPSLVQQYTGLPVGYLFEPFQQAMRYLYPVQIPSQVDADMLYLFDSIDTQRWTCITRANGNRVEEAELVRDAKQARTNVADTVELMYRGWYADEQQFRDDMRKRGVLSETEINKWVRLRQQIPGMSDLSSFMIRDTADPKIDWASSDASFRAKFQGNIKKWAEQQGIPEEFFLYYWRSHWQLPSNTALYEMMARLRPGRVPRELEVSTDAAKKLLEQNDMEPNWVDRILSVSHSVINETALKMGYKNGVLNDQQLYEGFLDLKHTEDDARLLVDMAKADALRQRANEGNLWSRRTVVQAYMAGEIDRVRAFELLREFTVTDELVEKALDDADELAQIKVRRECIKAIRQQVLKAELTRNEAIGELMALGMTESKATELTNGYLCYRESRGTELTIRYLNKIWLQGLISPEQLFTRLLNLRYTEDDAAVILQSWQVELSKKQRDEAAKIQRQRESQGYSARARYRTEVAWLQKQTDRKRKLAKDGLPDDTVDTAGVFVPPPPPPPPPPG